LDLLEKKMKKKIIIGLAIFVILWVGTLYLPLGNTNYVNEDERQEGDTICMAEPNIYRHIITRQGYLVGCGYVAYEDPGFFWIKTN
jgi:hypothetical protein